MFQITGKKITQKEKKKVVPGCHNDLQQSNNCLLMQE